MKRHIVTTYNTISLTIDFAPRLYVSIWSNDYFMSFFIFLHPQKTLKSTINKKVCKRDTTSCLLADTVSHSYCWVAHGLSGVCSIKREMQSNLLKAILSVSVSIIENSKPHTNFKIIFQYGNQCVVLLVNVTFAHFGTAFCQDIFLILTHFPMCNLLQIKCCIFCICQRTKLYQLHVIYCLMPEIDTITPDMTQS